MAALRLCASPSETDPRIASAAAWLGATRGGGVIQVAAGKRHIPAPVTAGAREGAFRGPGCDILDWRSIPPRGGAQLSRRRSRGRDAERIPEELRGEGRPVPEEQQERLVEERRHDSIYPEASLLAIATRPRIARDRGHARRGSPLPPRRRFALRIAAHPPPTRPTWARRRVRRFGRSRGRAGGGGASWPWASAESTASSGAARIAEELRREGRSVSEGQRERLVEERRLGSVSPGAPVLAGSPRPAQGRAALLVIAGLTLGGGVG